MTSTGVRPPTINGTVTALRFWFGVTVDRVAVAKPLTMPIVLSPEEVARFLEAVPRASLRCAVVIAPA